MILNAKMIETALVSLVDGRLAVEGYLEGVCSDVERPGYVSLLGWFIVNSLRNQVHPVGSVLATTVHVSTKQLVVGWLEPVLFRVRHEFGPFCSCGRSNPDTASLLSCVFAVRAYGWFVEEWSGIFRL